MAMLLTSNLGACSTKVASKDEVAAVDAKADQAQATADEAVEAAAENASGIESLSTSLALVDAKAVAAQSTADSAVSATQANAADISGLSNEVDGVDARLETLEARPAVNVISDAIDGIRGAVEGVAASEKAVGDLKSFLAEYGFSETAKNLGPVNADTVKTGGFYSHYATGSTNFPQAGGGFLIVLRHANDSVVQLWTPNGSTDNTMVLYKRRYAFSSDTWSLWKPLGKIPITGTTNFYVDAANGDDSNTGLSGSPVKTVTRMLEILRSYEPGQNSIRVDFAAGDYGDVTLSAMTGYSANNLRFYGSGVENTKFGLINCIATYVYMQDFTCAKIISQYNSLIYVSSGELRIENNANTVAVDCYTGGKYVQSPNASVAIKGFFSGMFYAGDSNAFYDIRGAIKFIDNPTVTNGVYYALRGGKIMVRSAVTYEGSFTGRQWWCGSGGEIDAELYAGLTSIPGTIAGGPTNPLGARKAVLGIARVHGLIRSDGSLLRDFGIISCTRNSIGNYTIVHSCNPSVPIVTPCYAPAAPIVPRVCEATSDVNYTVVRMFDLSGNPVDSYFTFAVL